MAMTAARLSQDDLLTLHAEACALAAQAFGVSNEALTESRDRKASFARHVAVYLMRMSSVSFPQLCAAFGGRSLSTIHHALSAIENARDDNAFDAKIDALEIALRRRLRNMGRPASYGLERPHRAE